MHSDLFSEILTLHRNNVRRLLVTKIVKAFDSAETGSLTL